MRDKSYLLQNLGWGTLLVLTLSGAAGCDDDKTVAPRSGTGGAGAPDGGGTGGAPGNGGMAGTAVTDTDFVVARFKDDGTPDMEFGSNGIARFDLGSNAGTTREQIWSLSKDATNRLILFGVKRGEGTRVDSDRVVMRLTANGARDTTFGMDVASAGGAGGSAGAGGAGGSAPAAKTGMHVLNIGNIGDTARNGLVQADGKILSSGYFAQPTGVGAQTANRLVLLRLGADGSPDTTFGAMGIVSANPFMSTNPTTQWGFAEAYGVVQQPMSGKYVTAGYGRMAPSGKVNVLSFRFDGIGAFDTTWATAGIFEKDFASGDDRGRNIAALPDDRVVIVGSSEQMPSQIDALAMVVGPNGAPDATFNAGGAKTWRFDRPEQAFYGLAVSSNGLVAASGYRAGGAGMNDDAIILISSLAAGGAEVAAPIVLSTTGNDRLWATAFDEQNRLYATGYVTEDGDNRMVLARINTADGTLDTTFGGGAGWVSLNASAGALLEEARGIVVQSDGKIVIAGVAEHK